METPKKEARRGRRSSCILANPQCSPTVVEVPLSESLIGVHTSQAKMNELEKRCEDLLAYKEQLKAEQSEWLATLDKYKRNMKNCYQAPLNRPKANKRLSSQLETGLRAKYVLGRIEDAFEHKFANLAKQKTIDTIKAKNEEQSAIRDQLDNNIEDLKRVVQQLEEEEDLDEELRRWEQFSQRQEQTLRDLMSIS